MQYTGIVHRRLRLSLIGKNEACHWLLRWFFWHCEKDNHRQQCQQRVECELQFEQPQHGQQQQPVQRSISALGSPGSALFLCFAFMTRDELLNDLRQAYLDARRRKRNKPYQQRFEANLESNLESLCDALWNRTYKPLPSDCFIVTDPKRREVFAAHFRDRIVHHLYFNYTHELFERTFIQDSYSCIKGRGTHFGIHRLRQHILQESRNYTRNCYVLKMDIRGYSAMCFSISLTSL